MYQPPIVKFPVFSVTWAEATDDDGSCTPAVVAAGGGGSGKTGISNKITLIAYRGGSKHPEHAIAHEIETSPETPNCVTADTRGQLIAASFGRIVRTYANLPSGFHVLAEFQADFAERESAVNSLSFSELAGAEDAMGGALLLATGGEDGALRVWQLSAGGSPGARDSEVNSRDPTGNAGRFQMTSVVPSVTGRLRGILRVFGNRSQTRYCSGIIRLSPPGWIAFTYRGFPEAKGGVDLVPSLQVDLVGECKGHSKPVTCVRFHPSSMLVLTSSKDGTCRLWDWQRGAEAAVMVTSSGLPSSVEAPAVISRSCCFSPDKPDTLYSVQSGRRGSAYVTQWRYRVGEGGVKKKTSRGQSARQGKGQEQEQEGETPLTCVTEPVKVACVSGCPATSISIRSDGTRLAVGTVNGAVAVYRLPGFAKVMQYPAHDLPVTGLGFAPGDTGAQLGGYDLVAASADYKITLLKSQGSSFRLAVQQILAFLWAAVSFIFTSTYRVIRITLSALMTIIPVLGLMVIGASVLYYPENLLDVIERALGVEPLEGGAEAAPWDEVDRASIVT